MDFEIEKEQIDGIVFSEEAVEKALSSLQYPLPIVYSSPYGEAPEEIVIGYVDGKDPENHFDENKKLVSTSFSGKLFRKESCDGKPFRMEADFVINKLDGNVIMDFRVVGVSIVCPETNKLRQAKRKEQET